VSSHWRRYGGLFDIDMDAEGNLRSVVGAGIGSMRWSRDWKGVAQRVLDQVCILLHLFRLPDKKVLFRLLGEGKRLCRRMGLHLTLDAFRQICTLAVLEKYIRQEIKGDSLHVLMIGDGYGFLSALFKRRFPPATVVLVDIGKTLLLQSYYCQRAYPRSVHTLAEQADATDQADFIYCPAERLEVLEKFTFDIAVNIASMQEMDPRVVNGYFAFLRKNFRKKNLFYCCNREKKTMPGGEVSEFVKYPWRPEDQYLIDGPCPWHQYFMAVGRSGNEVSLFGIPIPFVHLYDGSHLHRLAVMATEERVHRGRALEGSRNPGGDGKRGGFQKGNAG